MLADVIAAQIAAVGQPSGAWELLTRFAADEGGNARASIVGVGQLTSATLAALVNATAAYALDLEPVQITSVTHAAAVVVPAALATAEITGSGGCDVLDAIIVGLETADRIGRALNANALYKRGLHPTAVAGGPAAAVTAARLLGLDTPEAARAVGLASTQSSGLMAWELDPTEQSRAFNPGIAARNGVTAAMLAAQGYGGPPYALEGAMGLLRAFSDHSDADALDSDLGKSFAVESAQFKYFPVCAFLQSVAEVALRMSHVEDLRLDSVQLELPSYAIPIVSETKLLSHSAAYVTAVALSTGSLTLEDILHDRRNRDPRIATLVHAIDLCAAEDLDSDFPQACPARLTVATSRGSSITEIVRRPSGHPENRLSCAELADKFYSLVDPVLGHGAAANLFERAHGLGDESTVYPLMRILRCSGSDRVAYPTTEVTT